MITSIHSMYENGVFRPTDTVSLEEGTNIEVLAPQGAAFRDLSTVARKMADIASRAPRNGKLDLASRDHDRYLYARF